MDSIEIYPNIHDTEKENNSKVNTCMSICDNQSSLTTTQTQDDYLKELKICREKYPKQLIFGHMNINSLRNKMGPIADILLKGYIDVFVIQETKLDSSFPHAQFHVTGYSHRRMDNKADSGGLIMYIRDDIPNRPRCDIEESDTDLESMCMDVTIDKEKWLILTIYCRPPTNQRILEEKMSVMLDKMLTETTNIIVLGDMNLDMKDGSKRNTLHTIMSNFELTNLITQPTCFKGNPATLIDVILVSKQRRFIKETINFDLGVSDFHHLIAVITKKHVPKKTIEPVTYRSYKHFNEEDYIADIERIPFHICNVFDDDDDVQWAYHKLLLDVIDEHAPMKKRRQYPESAPFMNTTLRKVIYKKRMARNAWNKDKSNDRKWETYRSARNLFVTLKRTSINNYFTLRCIDGPKGAEFWKTVKPFMTNKNNNINSNIILHENNEIICDKKVVCDTFNQYFATIADGIGSHIDIREKTVKEICNIYETHPSINTIKRNRENNITFSMESVSEGDVLKELQSLNVKKSCGYDHIPAKLLKTASKSLAPSLTYIINHSIQNNNFPQIMKKAEVSPIFKKDNNMDKTKYRPVSVLTTLSKITEKLMAKQTTTFLGNILNEAISAYRKNHGCEHVLLRAIEDWKCALDNGDHVGAILMDLSKAFDSIPHGLLIAKLHAYGADNNTCELFLSYLTNRKQRVKVGNERSDWVEIKKGVPQGSVLGPHLFNLFLNDIYHVITKCKMLNYADDNTLSHQSRNHAELKQSLETDASNCIKWFDDNDMGANADKFQGITFGKTSDLITSFTIGNTVISCDNTVKLLGVTFDQQLNFNKHIDTICEKASKQVNALIRLSKRLGQSNKLIIFNSFIKANFNYCPLVWMCCGKVNVDKIEKLQYRALKFVYNDFISDYDTLLSRAKCRTMLAGRLQKLAIEVFKCVHKLNPTYVNDMFKKNEVVYEMRNPYPLHQRKFKTITNGFRTFSYMGSKLWNELPNELKKTTTLDEFKIVMRTWDGPTTCDKWY